MDKRTLSERDICTKFITPALRQAGWDEMSQIREEVSFTKGRIIVRGKLVSRGQAKRADYILYLKPNIPLALIEAKDNSHSVGDGMQQGLDYAATLDIPFVFSSNGDGFVFHDRTGADGATETNLALDAFPLPADLWARYRAWKGLTPEAEQIVLQDYFDEVAVRPRATTRSTPSTPLSRPSPRAATASCWSWRPAPARPTPPSRSSGGCGRRAARNASCSWPTATC
jgi:type I restriction enzyme R subunit